MTQTFSVLRLHKYLEPGLKHLYFRLLLCDCCVLLTQLLEQRGTYGEGDATRRRLGYPAAGPAGSTLHDDRAVDARDFRSSHLGGASSSVV